jgi:hypothetical protein
LLLISAIMGESILSKHLPELCRKGVKGVAEDNDG